MESRSPRYNRTANPHRRTGRAMDRRFSSVTPPPAPMPTSMKAIATANDASATQPVERLPNIRQQWAREGHILSTGMPVRAERKALHRDATQPSVAGRHIAGIDNAELVAALVRGDAEAWTLLVDRFGRDVERLVAGALGVDADIADIVQDVFVRVMERIHQLRDPAALKGWISSVAVFAARGHIRRRRRWRWIRFLAPSDIPDTPAATASPESHAILRATYTVLESLPENERLAFSLRFISEMELTEVAAACGVSLATIKRRLSRAEINFLEGAKKDPLLTERIERGERWRSK